MCSSSRSILLCGYFAAIFEGTGTCKSTVNGLHLSVIFWWMKEVNSHLSYQLFDSAGGHPGGIAVVTEYCFCGGNSFANA